MQFRADALDVILHQPLDYLHPHRGCIPRVLDTPAVRPVLNQILLRTLALSCPAPVLIKNSGWINLWIKHWFLLPQVAKLMGAQLMWPHLARGSRMRQLDASVRAFARVDLGPRANCEPLNNDGLDESLLALGLGALMAWEPELPPALTQRLKLQFSAQVVALQQSLRPQAPNASLFLMAVQHARIHQNRG